MKLDSVRSLKASLLKPSITMAGKPLKVAARSMSARAIEDIDPVPRTLAMGITPRGKNDYALAVRVQSRAALRDVEKITARAKGEVDVRYVGRVTKRAKNLQGRQRPLIIGCSIGHFLITAGTLGCFVRTKGGLVRMLSNNHVLANENQAKAGDAILQPGRIDGGKKPAGVVGTLGRFVRLRASESNIVDCALALVMDGVAFDARTLDGIGTLGGLAASPVDEGDAVAKVGRTTGTTRGRVTTFELDNLVVEYDIGNVTFDDQIEIEGAGKAAFSQGGDSGSLIVNSDREAVALLFAGSDQGGKNGQGLTYANPIGAVLSALEVDLLT